MKWDDVYSIVWESVHEVLPEVHQSAFLKAERLVDLGANSIDRMEIVTLAMEKVNIKVPLVEISSAKDIHSLVDFFLKRING